VWVARLLRVAAVIMVVFAAYLALGSTVIDWQGSSYNCGPTFLAAFPNDPLGQTAEEYDRGTKCLDTMYLRLFAAVGLTCAGVVLGGPVRRRILRGPKIPPRPDA
jgi:hypothetical protein